MDFSFGLCILISICSHGDAASAHAAAFSNARRAGARGRRLSPAATAGGIVYASKKEGLHRESDALPSEGGKQQPGHVELLRFVTAYRTGIEALVDMTPYTPLIHAAVAANNLTIYNFLDTWVSNHTEHEILYMSNTTGKCRLTKTSDGNGWGLTASLVFWPPRQAPPQTSQTPAPTLPRESVTLASGYLDANYPIGRVSFHEGNVSEGGKSVLLEKPVDLSTIHQGTVYDLSKNDVGIASLMGYVAQQTELFTRSGNSDALEELMEDSHDMLLFQALAAIDVTSVDNATQIVHGKYNGSQLNLTKAMPVFFDVQDIYTPRKLKMNGGTGWWMNSSLELKPMGNITFADGKTVTMKMDHPCLPSKWSHNLPKLLVPFAPHALAQVEDILDRARRVGIEAAAGAKDANATHSSGREPMLLVSIPVDDIQTDPGHNGPTLLKPNRIGLISPNVLGRVDLLAADAGGPAEDTWQRLMLKNPIGKELNITDGSKVLVLTQEHHGRLMERKFKLPNLVPGDKVIMQFAVTGHGWSATAEQCGEYCHAVYRLTVNGRPAANVTLFRDDCKDNPIDGSVQSGTWDESRNGWCPGTVVPGLFIDMTNHTQKGANNLTIDLVVWSNVTLQYEPYTDYAGFIFQDRANLAVGMTAFVYDESAVKAIHGQNHAYTPAEHAIVHGCSVPERLKPPAFVLESSERQVLLQMGSSSSSSSPSDSISTAQHHQGIQPGRPRHLMRSMMQEPESFMGRLAHHSTDTAVGAQKDSVTLPEHPRMARAEIVARPHGMNINIHQSPSEAAAQNRHVAANSGTQAQNAHIPQQFDFQARAPWFLYNETAEDHIDNIVHIPLFVNKLVQGSSRNLQVRVDSARIPKAWGQVALHFHLHKPPGKLEYDHWDRVGSFGLQL